jgi:lysozyme
LSALSIACARLQTEEGFRALPYTDTLGNLTVGYGYAVNKGISKVAAAALLQAQAQECEAALSAYPWFQGLDDARASVFIDLSINLGLHGLLAFPSMLHYTALRDWLNAKAQLLDSDAARELPSRYQALADILETGTE